MAEFPTSIIFEEAGTVMLTKRINSGPLSTEPSDIFVSERPTVKSVSFRVSKEKVDIETGNSVYPADTRTRKITGQVSVVFNSVDRQLHRFALGMTKKEVTDGASFPLIGVEYVVGTSSATVVLPYKASSILAVKDYDTGAAIKAGTASPATGTYNFDSGTNTLTFNEDMKGKKVTVSYMASATATSQDVLAATPVDYTYQAVFCGKASKLKGASGSIYAATTIDSVKFSGDISLPDKSGDFGDWTVTLDMVEPFGDSAVVNSYVETSQLTPHTAG